MMMNLMRGRKLSKFKLVYLLTLKKTDISKKN